MISGTPKALLLMFALLPTATWCADSTELIERLARPAPASVDFAELRFSSMLKKPVKATGTLRYLGPQQLEREVTSPRHELTRIDADSVRIERDGSQPRVFALDRVPELRVLLSSFTALLTGDAPALERDFRIDSHESNDSWMVTLHPLDKRIERRVPELRIQGHANDLRCLTLVDARGGASVMLFGPAAQQAPQDADRNKIDAFCRGGA